MTDFKNIKLIAADMDGTLLHSDHSLNPEFFAIFQQLRDLGICFTAASGRQYASLKSVFERIQNEMYFIAENGGYVTYQNQKLIVQQLDENLIKTAIAVCRNLANTFPVLCGTDIAYIEDDSFSELIFPFYPRQKLVENLLEVKDEIVKIAVYNTENAEKKVYPYLENLENNYLVKVSGEFWVDVSTKTSNKGFALKQLQKILHISNKETMAFGDYLNDTEMMQEACFSYAMSNAHPELKKL
ncbi:MAG: Cof-type HAD-IIB family hydrolase, partial [Flavobacteriaceae bacterium]|nr:Cof-type HAD-IIB family hydrolase [Flavobacteriaceae bacterium]